MRRLILMRHAKSSWSDAGLDDFDRPLNKRGKASAKAMGHWLKERGYRPEEIMSSSARRTGETCLGLKLKVPAMYKLALYHAGPETMLAHLRLAQEPSLLMIGHNPGIAEFAARLVDRPPDHPRFDDYPTCATLVVDFHTPWSEVGWGSGKVVDFAIPREIMDDPSGA